MTASGPSASTSASDTSRHTTTTATTTTSAAHDASTITRNWLLGLPASGPRPGSAEEADLHAAEAFVSDVYAEIAAYDMANAQAMEAYARRVCSRLPWRRRRNNNDSNNNDSDNNSYAQTTDEGAATTAATTSHAHDATLSASSLHTRTRTTRRGDVVQRSNVCDTTTTTPRSSVPLRDAELHNTWLFKRRHPGWTPLMQRWWVPWLCMSALALVWTPDTWKLRTLYACDYYYAQLRQRVHLTYWWLTMSSDDYDTLVAEMAASAPRSVKATDCPF